MTKRYLIYIGQYPYQTTKSRACYLFFLLFSIITLIIPQLHQLGHTIENRDIDQIIMCLPPLLTNSVCFVKLFNLQINRKKFRKIFDLISEEWRTVTVEGERRILQKFAEEGSKFGLVYRNFIVAVLSSFSALPLAPVFLDIISPRNDGPRPRNTLFEVDYLVDNDKYFYPIYIHAVWSSMCSILIVITVDSMYMLVTHHACGLFVLNGIVSAICFDRQHDKMNIKIQMFCRHRLKCIAEELKEDVKEYTDMEEKFIYSKVRQCVITHEKAIEFVEFLAASSNVSYFLQVGINMIGISITGVQTVIKLHQVEEAARFGVFVVSQNVHLFFNSLPGQKLINTSLELCDVIYSTEWYRFPLRVQKVLLTMQIRCRKPCKLKAGGLYDMSMENFGIMVKTSMSYFTMFLSLRE